MTEKEGLYIYLYSDRSKASVAKKFIDKSFSILKTTFIT